MRDRDQSRLASILALLVGIWVVISPLWISMSGAAMTSLMIVGIIIIISSLLQLGYGREIAPSWVVALAAVWLFVSAFIFSMDAGAMYSQMISAILAFVFAVWDGVEVKSIQTHQHQHTTT